MLFTIFLLGLVYAVLIAVLIAAGAGAVTIAIVAAGLFAVQLFTSDKIALASMGARQVTPQEAPQLHAIVDRLCVQANIPKPRVAIAQTPMPNAFAVGRSPKTATVCATTGIVQLLEPAELEAVLGHEITHVLNRDVVVMTIASFYGTGSEPWTRRVGPGPGRRTAKSLRSWNCPGPGSCRWRSGTRRICVARKPLSSGQSTGGDEMGARCVMSRNISLASSTAPVCVLKSAYFNRAAERMGDSAAAVLRAWSSALASLCKEATAAKPRNGEASLGSGPKPAGTRFPRR